MNVLTDAIGFFGQALVEAVLVGALAGLVGVLVVLRKRTFFATALTHATFPGGIIAVLLGWNVLIGNAIFAVVLTLVMLALTTWFRQRAAVASGVVLTGGFALGTVLTGLNPSLPIRVQTFLTGSILAVDLPDVQFAGILLVISISAIVLLRRQLLFSTFDPAGYEAAGFRGWRIDAVVLVLITATVVALMPAVGAILAIALLAAPALAAAQLTVSMRGMLFVAPILGAASGVVGLLISARWPVPAGPAIVLSATGILLVSWGLRRALGLMRRGGSNAASARSARTRADSPRASTSR